METLIVLLAAILFAFPAIQEFLWAILTAVPTGASFIDQIPAIVAQLGLWLR